MYASESSICFFAAALVGSATFRFRVQWRQYTGQLCVT